jgi:hypothetical protein
METRKPVKKKARERTQSEGQRRSWCVIGFSINTSMTILRTSKTSWGPRWRFEDLDGDFEGLDGDFRTAITILRTSTTIWGPRRRLEDLDYDFEDLDWSSKCQIQAPQSRIQRQLTYSQIGIFNFGTWNLRPRLQN